MEIIKEIREEGNKAKRERVDMEERDYYALQEDCENIIRSCLKSLNNQKDEKHLYELKAYIDELKVRKGNFDIEKAQVIMKILQSKNSSDIQAIISYLECSRFGWQGDEYNCYSRCSWSCRKNFHIDNTPEMTEFAFGCMDEIFLHKEYGAITTYLFGYCIAALFSSRLKEQHQRIPFFLQIACKRNSNVYRLVHEIVQICDVNVGLSDSCKMHEYRECEHDHLTIYPSETGDKLLETLLYYRDIPIIIDGYENEKMYEILIREVANIPSKIKRLDIKERFNILPIFISPVIQSQFQNVFSIDLTELDITDEYIELILDNEQRLGSWVLELVKDAKEYFAAGNATSYSQRSAYEKLLEKRRPEKTIPIFYNLSTFIGQLRIKYNGLTKLTSKDIENVGYLSYFFMYYMKVFNGSIRLTHETPFIYREKEDKHIPAKLIDQIVKQATDSLFQLHSVYSPAAPEVINIEIDSSDEKKAKRIKTKGAAYAKDIVKYYQSYKVNIRIPTIQYQNERYIFKVKIRPGTSENLLNRYAEEVRRLLELEVFIVEKTSGEIKIVASEKSLGESSLISILQSDQFQESKMEIPYAVGYDILGEAVIADIADFPHLLIGGTSGSGKSSALHSLLMSIVYKQPADKVKLLLMDFGASRLKMFKDVPHMLTPGKIISDFREGCQFILSIQKCVEQRQKILEALDIRDYDKRLEKMPSIVCVIDEFPIFIKQRTEGRGNKNLKAVIEDVLARARKVKIHLILTAQDTTKGGIDIANTNLAAGIAFQCENWQTSKAIIGYTDAVNLSGKGSMYFKCKQGLRRLQMAFMRPEKIMDKLNEMSFVNDCGKIQYDEVKFQFNTLQQSENSKTDYEYLSIEDEDEELLLEIVQWMQDKECISNNQLKHDFEMGYERANRILARLEKAGLISAQKRGAKLPRKIEQDEVEKYLKRYKDIAEIELEKDINIDNTQFNRELLQEQNIESIVEISDIQDAEDNSVLAQSQPKAKRHIKIDPKFIRDNTSRKKGKKKPAH